MERLRAPLSVPEPHAQLETSPDIELKDEAYIRNHMHVPAAEDYPGLSSALFVEPKKVMFQQMQHFARFKADFSQIHQDSALQCKLTCDIMQGQQSEVVIGEGSDTVTPCL